MIKIKLPAYRFGYSNKTIRSILLSIFIVGQLACGFGPFGVDAAAEQEKGLGASHSDLLFKALVANDINAVHSMVEAGANLSRVNLKGQTAMDVAVDLSHFHIAQYLVFARRIEQSKMLKPILPMNTRQLSPSVNIIEQTSPESAPFVEVSRALLPAPPKLTNIKKVLPVRKKQEVIQRSSKPSYDQLMSAAKTLIAVADALPKKSLPKPVIPKRKLATIPLVKLTKISPVEEPTKPVGPTSKAPKIIPEAPRTIFVIGPNGRLKPASVDQILRAKKITTQQINRFLPDIEPRKSFFIPKPRNKPSFKPQVTTNQAAHQPALQTSRIPIASTPRIEVPDFAKPSMSRASNNTVPQTGLVRSNKRVSPLRHNKLRRRLRTRALPNRSITKAHTATFSEER